MEVQLAGAGKPAKKMQRRADCVTDNTTPSLDYLTDYNVLTASFYRNLSDSANVTSNILQVTQGTVASEVAIVISNIKATDAPNAVISFPNSNITVTKQEYLGPSNQEKLGNGPEKTYFYTLTLDIPADQAIGNYDVLIEVNNAGVPVPQMIQVIEN